MGRLFLSVRPRALQVAIPPPEILSASRVTHRKLLLDDCPDFSARIFIRRLVEFRRLSLVDCGAKPMNPSINDSGNEGYEKRACLFQAFPDRSAQLECSYRNSPEFREICDDFFECTAILEKATAGGGKTAAEIADYDEIREQLKQEIHGWMERHPL